MRVLLRSTGRSASRFTQVDNDCRLTIDREKGRLQVEIRDADGNLVQTATGEALRVDIVLARW